MSDQYEFSEQENEHFSKLASGMKFVGIAALVLGAISMIAGFSGEYTAVVNGILYLFIGYLTMTAARPVQMIVDTEGNDIDHLMTAIQELGKLYKLQKALIIFALVCLGLIVFFGLFGLFFLGGLEPA